MRLPLATDAPSTCRFDPMYFGAGPGKLVIVLALATAAVFAIGTGRRQIGRTTITLAGVFALEYLGILAVIVIAHVLHPGLFPNEMFFHHMLR